MHFIIRSVWLKALGMALASNLWQAALIWVVYILITGRRSRFSAAVKHTLATIGLAMGTCWFIYSLVVNILTRGESMVGYGWLSFSLISFNGFSSSVYSIKYFVNACLPYLSFAYLITLFFMSMRYVRYFQYSKKLRSSGLQKMKPELRLFVGSIGRRLGIHKKVAVWLSSVVESPMTIGFLKPIILIPIATVNHLSIQQVETILLHELAHIRRNDYLLNLFITLAGILFFFNPFSRLLIHSIKKERENCCDDLVMQFSYDSTTYASALLSLERARKQHYELAIAAIGKSNQLLLERIRRVTGHKIGFTFYQPRLIATIFLSVLMSLIILLQIREIKIAKSEQPIRIAGFETQPIGYFGSTQLSVRQKNAKQPGRKKTKPVYPAKENQDLVMTGQDNNESENTTEPVTEEVSEDLPSESRESSLALAYSSTPALATIATGNFPFVPSSSFNYKIVEDPLRPNLLTYSDEAEKNDRTLEKAVQAIDNIDWAKIEKGLLEGGKLAYNEAIKAEINRSIKKLTLERKNLDESTDLSEAEESRIRENIELQMVALAHLQPKNDTETKQLLEKQMMLEKLKLQQNWARKQRDLIKKVEEIKRKTKIVYI
jgi:beta-lactamase regulating signal transducer with metallopeptidase domain